MMVVSLKLTKKRMLGFVGILGAAAVWTMLIATGMAERAVMGITGEPGLVIQDGKGGLPDLSAGSNHERVAFLAYYGWEVKQSPVEVAEVTLPDEFGTVMQRYNLMQIEQGLDLTPYRGKKVTRWCYELLNYEDASPGERVVANLLVYDDTIIGGDICSATMNGFMHGFAGDVVYEE